MRSLQNLPAWFIGITRLRRLVLATFLLAMLSANAAPPATQGVVVTARVRAATGVAIRDAYVGLVPEWRTSSQPLMEQLVEKGVCRFRVQPGTYWLVAGAPGYGVTSFGPFVVSGWEMDVPVELSPLQPASGIVRDEAGHPIDGARVSTLNAAIPSPLGKLSELAARHLASDWSTTTDKEGAWKLRLPQGAVPLLFEAPGRAAEWRITPADHSIAVDVPLAKGAELTVSTDRGDANLVVTLARDDSGAASTIPGGRQPLVWARSAKASVLTWESLPPGTYTIYAKYPDPRYFMQAATKLATVTLAAGQEQRIEVVLPPVRPRASSSAALLLQDLTREDLGKDVQAFGRDAQGRSTPLEHFVEEVMGGSVLHLNAEASGPPYFAMTEDRFFSAHPALAEAVREADAAPSTAAVHSRADADVLFRSLEKELQIPQAGLARLRDCRGGGDVIVPIEIRSNGFARFSAASECRSLVIELEPFEPVVTNRVLHEGEQSLGEFVLRAAAAADVRVTRDPGGEIVDGATVRIMTIGDDAERDANPVVIAETKTDDAGWAHFTALPPHRELRAIAETAAGEKSEASLLRLTPRGHGLVDPLSVREPASLTIEAKIDPAFQARFPSTHILTLFVRPAEPFRQSEKLQQNVSDEPIRFGPLAPGRWLVTALVKVENSYAPFELEAVELKAGDARRIAPRITPNLFEGIVTSEGAPVVAKVMLEDGDRVLSFPSDARGLFHVVLEKPGLYRVAVERLSAQSNDIPIGDVAFTDPSRRIEIAIPNGSSVIARARIGDHPVPARTLITMTRRRETGLVDRMTARGRFTNAAGEATFDDVAPGGWTFSVQDNESRNAAEKSVSIEPGENQTVNLELIDSTAIEGTIRDLGGLSLPRARVECLYLGPGGNLIRAGAVSDAEGHFAIDLTAPPPPSALCSVVGPLGSVDAVRMTPGERVDFTVAAASATLRIADWGEQQNPDSYWLVTPDGRPVSVKGVAGTLGQPGAPLAIPALAAGRWKLVRIESPQQWSALARGLGASLPAVAEVNLRAGAPEKIQLNPFDKRPAP